MGKERIFPWQVAISTVVPLEIGGITLIALPDVPNEFGWALVIAGGILTALAIILRVGKSRREVLRSTQQDVLLDSQTSNVLVPKRPSPELVIEIHEYNFGFGGGGYPPKRFDDDNALWLRLGVTFKMNQTMRIETLYLLLSGESIQPHGESGYYFYFEMPKWVKSGEVRTIQLVAFAKGTNWGSEEKEIPITFPPQ